MKKLFAAILALTLSLSLAACGGADKPAPASSAAPAAPASSAAAPAPASSAPAGSDAASPLENAEFSPEQQAAAQKFIDLTTRYDAVADKVNADPNLAELQEVVTAMNEVADAIIAADEIFVDPAGLTPEVLAELDNSIKQTNLFLDEVEAMLANFGGKEVVVVPVQIVNETGADLYTLSMSPANDENWGVNLLETPLAAGETGVTQMTFTADTLVWDLLAGDSEDTTLSFMGLDFTNVSVDGATLTLSAGAGGEYVAAFS